MMNIALLRNNSTALGVQVLLKKSDNTSGFHIVDGFLPYSSYLQPLFIKNSERCMTNSYSPENQKYQGLFCHLIKVSFWDASSAYYYTECPK